MPEVLAAFFEFCQNAIIGPRRVTVNSGAILKEIIYSGHDLQHMSGVLPPIGGGMKDSFWAQYSADIIYKGGLQDTPFIVTSLMPWIWEKKIETGQTGIGQSVLYNLHCIVTNDTDIGQSLSH